MKIDQTKVTTVEESKHLIASGKDIYSAPYYWMRSVFPSVPWYLLSVPMAERQLELDEYDRFFHVNMTFVKKGLIVPAWDKQEQSMKTLEQLITIAEELGWKVTSDTSDGIVEYDFQKYSPAGQDFSMNIRANQSKGQPATAENLEENLRAYADAFDPIEEADLWRGPDGKGKNGAPENYEDIIADMQVMKDEMLSLHDAWQDAGKETPKDETDQVVEIICRIIEHKVISSPSKALPKQNVGEDVYATLVETPTGKAVLLHWPMTGDYTRAILIPESEFEDKDRVREAVEAFYEN